MVENCPNWLEFVVWGLAVWGLWSFGRLCWNNGAFVSWLVVSSAVVARVYWFDLWQESCPEAALEILLVLVSMPLALRSWRWN
jgi:hypothetical protein